MITGPSIRNCVDAALGILESEEVDEATTASDIRGKHPGDKDYQRMYDIQDKAHGSDAKALDLAKKMADAIGRGAGGSSREKAHRRAKAAMDVFPGRLGKQMAQMFMDAADVKFLPRSTESKETTVSSKRIDGPSIRRDMDEVTSILSGDLTENIDNISQEQAQEEGEEFLRIIGLREGRPEAKTVSEESDAVGTQIEDLLDDVRDAIGKAHDKWRAIGGKVRADNHGAYVNIDKVMSRLHDVDNDIARIL